MATGVAVEALSRRLLFGSAAPTLGTWQAGDAIVNNAPTAGSVAIWRCVTAGTPGTWEALSLSSGAAPVVSAAYKPANTSRGDTNTRTADPDLTLPVSANGVYIVDTWLGYEATTAADIVHSWSGPTGATMVWGTGQALPSNATTNLGATSSQRLTVITNTSTLGGIGSGSGVYARPSGLLTVGVNTGTFALMWAAGTAGVIGDAILYAGSWLRLTKIA